MAKSQYDAQGRRAAKTINGVTTGFLYGGLSEDNMAQELLGDTNTAGVKSHVISAGIDETLLREVGGQMHSVLADGNNNTVRLLDSAQAKVVDYSYEPYGRTTVDAANANTQQYTGRENDDLTGNGLYYYRNRYYMPGCMRFISEDPIGWASGQTNNYAYVGGNPIQARDPSGKIANIVIGAAIGGLGNLGYQLWRNNGNFGCVNWGGVGKWAFAGAAAGALVPEGLIVQGGMQTVTRWGASEIGAGDWVMTGGNSVRNWVMAGGPELPYAIGDSVTTQVAAESLAWPAAEGAGMGYDIAAWIKGAIGQRVVIGTAVAAGSGSANAASPGGSGGGSGGCR